MMHGQKNIKLQFFMSNPQTLNSVEFTRPVSVFSTVRYSTVLTIHLIPTWRRHITNKQTKNKSFLCTTYCLTGDIWKSIQGDIIIVARFTEVISLKKSSRFNQFKLKRITYIYAPYLTFHTTYFHDMYKTFIYNYRIAKFHTKGINA